MKETYINNYRGDNTRKHSSAVGMIATYLDLFKLINYILLHC